MEVSVQTSGPVAVAVLTGGLDSASAASMQDLLCQLIDHHERILIDFTDVHCVSSTGLRTLLVLYRMAQGVGHSVGLVGLSNELCNIVWATGFLDFFTVSDTTHEAVTALAAKPSLEDQGDHVPSDA